MSGAPKYIIMIYQYQSATIRGVFCGPGSHLVVYSFLGLSFQGCIQRFFPRVSQERKRSTHCGTVRRPLSWTLCFSLNCKLLVSEQRYSKCCHASTIGAGNRLSVGGLFMPEAWMLGVEEIMDGQISKVSPVDLFFLAYPSKNGGRVDPFPH